MKHRQRQKETLRALIAEHEARTYHERTKGTDEFTAPTFKEGQGRILPSLIKSPEMAEQERTDLLRAKNQLRLEELQSSPYYPPVKTVPSTVRKTPEPKWFFTMPGRIVRVPPRKHSPVPQGYVCKTR